MVVALRGRLNGKAMINKPTIEFKSTSDASSKGFAGYLNEDWFYGIWSGSEGLNSDCNHYVAPPEIPAKDFGNINVFELVPVYLGVHRWKAQFTSHRIIIVSDNYQVVCMIKTGRSKNATCMKWLKKIFWLGVEYDIEFEAEYIRSSDNIIADCLSRLSYPAMRQKTPILLRDVKLWCIEKLFEF